METAPPVPSGSKERRIGVKRICVVLSVLAVLAVFSAPAADFNGDGTNDIAIFRPSTGLWAVRGGDRVYFGGSGDQPIPGDYNGDGTVDIAVFRPSTGLWAVRGGDRVYFGGSGDQPIPGVMGAGGGGGSDVWTRNGNKIYYNSGSVGVGTFSPYHKIHCHTESTSHSYLQFTNITTGAGSGDGVLVGLDPQADFRIHSNESNNIKFFINNVERARIAANGCFGIGRTDPRFPLDVYVSVSDNYIARFRNAGGLSTSNGVYIQAGSGTSSNTGSGTLIQFRNGGNYIVGSISHSNGTTNYNTSSDERLKENIAEAESASSLVDSLRVRQFDWKGSGVHQRYGFVA
jgi:hypothetical protein